MTRMPATKKVLAVLMLALALVGFSASQGFCWGSATHAFIDDNLGSSQKQHNLNEIYGGMAPDIFVYYFGDPAFTAQLYLMTHTNAQSVWDTARSNVGKAAAYGFASHNGVWGADVTAHTACRTCVDTTKGYVIQKAEQLMLDPNLNIGLPEPVLLEVCHNFVEWGVDIMIASNEPDFGTATKMVRAAQKRTPEFPRNLVRAYSPRLIELGMTYPESVEFLGTTEAQFRSVMIEYGKALQNTPDVALEQVSAMMAGLAEAYLTAMGVTLPPGVNIVDVVKYGTYQAMLLCEDDLNGEIGATIAFVDKGLKDNGVQYLKDKKVKAPK